MGRGGRFPTATKAEVQELAEEERRKELAQADPGQHVQRQGAARQDAQEPAGHAAGLEGRVPGHAGARAVAPALRSALQRPGLQGPDLVLGRNAYGTGGSGDSGSTPILVNVPSVGPCKVWCHIDITTPREDFLRHGEVEGPHIVVDSCQTGSGMPQRGGESIRLSPQDAYRLALHQFGCAQRGLAAGTAWPHEITGKLAGVISDKQETIRRKANRARTASDDDEPIGGLWC